MVVIKGFLKLLLIPVITAFALAEMAVSFLVALSGWIFIAIAGIAFLTAVLSYLMGLSDGPEALRMLGAAAASVCAAVSPECIVIGGGVAEALGESLLPVFEASFRANLFGLRPEDVVIRLSELGDDAVAVGATFLARENSK